VYPVTTDDQEACGHAHNGAGRQAAARKEPTLVRRFGTMLLVALAVAAVAAPARAVGAFGPAVTVVDLGCASGDYSVAKASVNADGVTRGWAVTVGASCGDDRIWYFQGAGGSWTRQRSPYRGVLMAAASDGTGAYLMYRASDGVHLAKRTPGGTFTAGRLLSDTTNRFIAGAVIATGGSWWAVWTEQTGQNRFGDPVYGLFQAKTYGTDQARQRITFSDDSDGQPDLALRPGGGAVLVWQRITELPETGSIRVATSADGAWASRAFTTGSDFGPYNQTPAVATDSRWTYVTWELDQHVFESDNRSGSFHSHRFVTPGSVPAIAASSGRTFVVWTTLARAGVPSHVFVAERSGGSWTGLNLPRTTPGYERAAEVTGHRGKATVLLFATGANGHDVVLARSQQ